MAAMEAAAAEEERRGTGGSETDERRRSSLLGGEVLKFKHLYGQMNKKTDTYYNLKPAVNISMESPLLTANKDFWACPWSGGGGPVYISRHGDFGKVEPSTVPLVNGHKSPAVALGFSPFTLPDGGSMLATGADDQHVKLWSVPKEGLTQSLGNEDAIDLSGHYYGVRALEFHPSAPILVSAAGPSEIFFWDLEKNVKMEGNVSNGLLDRNSVYGDGEVSGICNMSFNYDGSLLAIATKQCSAVLMDPREGCVVSEAGESDNRAQRVQWCTNYGGSDVLLTVGSIAGGRGRQMSLWDPRNLSKPTIKKKVDAATGQLFPIYDEGTNVVLLSGRGDTTIRIFELGPSCAKMSHCSDVLLGGTDPLCAFTKLPVQSCDVKNVETMRCLRLSQQAAEPISFILPRSNALKEYFHDDLFRDCRAPKSALSVAGWLENQNQEPVRESLQPAGLPLLSDKPPEEVKESNAAKLKAAIKEKEKESEETNAMMEKLQYQAKLRSSYHPNNSMGAKKGVDATPIYDSDEDDDGWSDDE